MVTVLSISLTLFTDQVSPELSPIVDPSESSDSADSADSTV